MSVIVRVDTVGERLWRGHECISLRPKTWAVLVYLASRPDALVTKHELLDALWPDAMVSEGTLNKSIGELRAALADDRGQPRFIETVARRGFRWIGGSGFIATNDAPATAPPVAAQETAGEIGLATPGLIARESELATLDRCYAAAAAGTRQLVFVTGEAGAGKSTLVDAFLCRLETTADVAIARGQCIDTYTQHEPFRPILEALERLAGRPDIASRVIGALRTHGRSWLRHMPSIDDAAAAAPHEAAAASGSMLRELASVVEAISRDRPLVLVIEDVHWADLATSDACNHLARRRDPARLMIVLTMRPADSLLVGHPLHAMRIELANRALATEVAAAAFTPASIREYVVGRCPGLELAPDLCQWVHYQSAGNPLFVRLLVDDLIDRNLFAQSAEGRWRLLGSPAELRNVIPDSLRALIERQIAGLSDAERAVVEAACVLPRAFEASSIATAAGVTPEDAEEICDALARRGCILRGADPAAASLRAPRFAFVHVLVQRVLLDCLPPSRARRYHVAAAEYLERDRRGDSEATAVELALHYSMAGDAVAALRNLQDAASFVMQAPGPREVIAIRERILDLVERNPDLPGYRRVRLVATQELALSRYQAAGFGDAETTRLHERVVSLAVAGEDDREKWISELGVLWGRAALGQYEEAIGIGRRLLQEAPRFDHPAMEHMARTSLASMLFATGELDETERLYLANLAGDAAPEQTFGRNLRAMSLAQLAMIPVLRGQWRRARELLREADEASSADGFRREAYLFPLLAYVHAWMGDDHEAARRIDQAFQSWDASSEYEMMERARFLQGLMLARTRPDDDGIERMQESLARQAKASLFERTGQCCLLAAEMLRRGMPGARAVIDDGFAHMQMTGESCFASELYRLRGEERLAFGTASPADAEADLRHAVATAHAQGAFWHELVATMSLARRMRGDGRGHEARTLLQATCDAFPGDEDLEDLQRARRPLADMA
ncbi:MAG TPA: AAA family ATPase [Candidatus Binatia bacterium]|nr:AAA family ATPase [Candidatus Binatia bacterium]